MEKKTREVKDHFHHIISRVHTVNVINPDHLAVLSGFSTAKMLFFLPSPYCTSTLYSLAGTH